VWTIAAALFAQESLRSAEAPPPIESFCENDRIMGPTLSPDGTKLAYLTSTGRDLDLAVFHLDTGKGEVVCNLESHTDSFAWKGNSRILFVELFHGNWSVSGVTVGQHKPDSFPGYGERRAIGSVIDWLPADPNHILVKRGLIGKMDVGTGEIDDTQPPEVMRYVGPYIADSTGTLRLRCLQWADGIELQHRRTDRDPFVTAYKWKWEEPFVTFLGFAGDPNTCFFLTHDEGNWGVLRGFDTGTFKLSAPLAKIEGAEIWSAVYSADRSKLIGLSVVGRYGEFRYWLDEKMRRNQATIDAALPGRHNLIVSWSGDMDVLVVLSNTGPDPGTYYTLDIRKRALARFGSKRPQVNISKLGRDTAEDIVARDGFILHAILTLPPGDTKGPYPLVLIPQGEIFKRRWVIRYTAQFDFLLSRGYAILALDYRGSSGYGKTYEDAGRHELAGKIPDDVEDAARWSVKSGYAAQGRICIFGSGIGGTLALVAATHTPDLYCCAINHNGEPDMTHMESGYDVGNNWLAQKNEELFFGNDTEAFARISPLSAIDKLRVPLLNIYDDPDHDRRWNHLEVALKASNKPCVLLKVLPVSNDILPYDRRLNYYRQVEAFLDKNLKHATGN
jgi:dienelactone hydrolase